MKIPLTFEPEKKLFYFFTVLRIPRFYRGFISIKFFYDSGSKVTILSEKDASILKIPVNRIPFSENIYGWGGSSLAGHLVRNVEFLIKNADNKIEKLKVQELYITESRKKDERTRDISLTSPSIIGNDFLIENKFKIIINPLGESYLESIEEKA